MMYQILTVCNRYLLLQWTCNALVSDRLICVAYAITVSVVIPTLQAYSGTVSHDVNEEIQLLARIKVHAILDRPNSCLHDGPVNAPCPKTQVPPRSLPRPVASCFYPCLSAPTRWNEHRG